MGDSGGRFVWYELATTDMAAAKAFYAGVLGWRPADASAPGSAYALFMKGETAVAGLAKLPPDARRMGAAPQWIGYAGVDDVNAAVAKAARLGGTIHVPPSDLPNVGRFSVIADPEMATLILVKERDGDRSAQATGPGHVVWHELLVSDLDKAFAFYTALLGWKKTEVYSGERGTYQQFSDGTETVGAIFARPEVPQLAQWLYYFQVDGIEAAAKRVEDGGGKVEYGPVPIPTGARIAHCKDPQGAIFALIECRVSVAIGCYSPRQTSNRPGGRPGGP
jgi:uncharacterized protein